MCVPGCLQHVQSGLNRRGFLGAGALAASARLTVPPAAAAEPRSFATVVDLTHTISPEFPTYFGKPGIEFQDLYTWAEHKLNLKIWTLNEHTGTHIDTPFHFTEAGASLAQLPVETLVCPLCVIDIAARAADNPDAQLTPDDITAWEGAHGPLPAGACVAMNSGWDGHAVSERFRNADGEGAMHFPGFHLETVQMLLEQRQVAGIAVDTLSLDHGISKDFAVHYAWLPAGRWGIECAAGLGALPPAGATLVVGAPKVKGATGAPVRLYALV